MGLLDVLNQEDQQAPDEQGQQGPEWAGLQQGLQVPAGVMTKPGVMSEAGVGAAPRAGQDVPRNVQEARHWSQSLDLQRIGQIARSLAGVPEEARTQIMARILGIPLKSKAQQASEAMLQRALIASRDRQQALAQHNKKLEGDAVYRNAYLERMQQMGLANLANSISRLTRDMSNMLPSDPKYLETTKTLTALHKQYEQYSKSLEKKNEGEGGGGGGGATAPAKPDVTGGY